MQLRDKTILITGGTSGIGRELVLQLVERGNKLIVLGRSQDKLDDLKKQLASISVSIGVTWHIDRR